MSPAASSIEWSILLPAFAAGLLVLLTHVPLGMQVLSRGIVFIDLAIAQIAGVGVIAADALGWEPQGWAVQVAAAGAALAGAGLLTLTERRWPALQEALIGVLFVLASCGALLLLAGNPHGGEHLKDLLVGQILWVGPAQLRLLALCTAVLLLVRALLPQGNGISARLGFYGVFSLAVTAAVQVVGVYLVFSSLILPALATLRWRTRPRLRLLLALGLGAGGYALGLWASARLDLPAGAVVVLTMAGLGLSVAAWRPKGWAPA